MIGEIGLILLIERTKVEVNFSGKLIDIINTTKRNRHTVVFCLKLNM